MEEIEQLLQDFATGEEKAIDKIIELLEPDLHEKARNILNKNGRRNHNSYSLVNDLCVGIKNKKIKFDKLNDKSKLKNYLFGVMDNIFLQWLKKDRAQKRAGDLQQVPSTELDKKQDNKNFTQQIAICHTLEKVMLTDKDTIEELTKMVEMKICGCTYKDMAEELKISEDAVKFKWAKFIAKAKRYFKLTDKEIIEIKKLRKTTNNDR